MRRRSKIIMAKETGSRLQATGILLAGGKNSRMKKNKAFLELEGQPLVERSLQMLKGIFSEVLLSSNEPQLYEQFGVKVMPDLMPDQGPIGGLQAGLRAASYETSFFVACDMPFLDSGLIRLLSRWAKEYDVVVPQAGGGLNPLHAFYARTCLPFIEENIRSGHLKIIDFYPQCKVRYVGEEELAAAGGMSSEREVSAAERLRRAFLNVNTPEEWDRLVRGTTTNFS